MQSPDNLITTAESLTLAEQIRDIGKKLGFQAVHFSTPDTSGHAEQYNAWVDAGYNGDMAWMARNCDKRFDGSELQPGTKTVISVRMNYQPDGAAPESVLGDPGKAYIARYALGRDYHKVLRKRLMHFAKAIEEIAGKHGYRPFVDSAPVMERQIAEQSGMGWIGKNTLLLAPGSGSWFFLGELFTDLELPFDAPFPKSHCGSCQQCLIDCPTDAFLGPNKLDARKCISYLTIEYAGSIPVELREKMGNRIYGCDDCQLVCPHNRKANDTEEADFQPRHNLDDASLLSLFAWSEQQFLNNTEGSPIRRIGYEQWTRNLAVALGNGPCSEQATDQLKQKLGQVSALVDEHIEWALSRLQQQAGDR
ncbi:tRNA epoxyqueuosine(34) reductase QueG [Reinekea marinisedimentorum]|uniref:Epoxyqueuosine reductase n=1 Tax=Reinekea marinisedimentorum TaxID=230495 RepID=A0A4R3IBT0_9GAMM|nr:tRNA epoxyqueuosine(34) reductase QueG [Reinekea marinisedimentorum]TCS42996.1 epoxyqueuosine reductase [Reinekea marinisedimentorum]